MKKKSIRSSNKEAVMRPAPIYENPLVLGSHKLLNKVAIVTGGDSGIGRAVALAFAKEGTDVLIVYLKEHADARFTQAQIRAKGRRCEILAGDIGKEDFCKKVIHFALRYFGKIDILVNNAGFQEPQEKLAQITKKQLDRTFHTNVYGMIFLCRAALPYLKRGSAIINTSSVTAYRGSEHLLDYAATKGAIISFTRSLARNLAESGIRVNAVAPGPIWTPLVAATFDKSKLARFGHQTPMKRAGQPAEVAPCFVFLASDEASYITGQVLHPNGGEIVNA